jgi:proline iminopeptidase
MRRCVALMSLACGLASAEDGAVPRDGFDLRYRAEGAGPPIVFLSGGPGLEVSTFTPAAAFFPAGYRFVFLEQRGTGRSIPAQMTAESFTLALMVEDLEALRVHLKQERLLLAGHSWGGMLAMAYAAAHPGKVDGLILIASGGPTNEFEKEFGRNLQARMSPADRKGAPWPAYFFDRAIGLAFAATVKPGDLHELPSMLLNRDLHRHYDSRPGLRRLDRPALVVHGEDDPIGRSTAEQIHALIRASTLRYIPRCGHFPWLEQPDAFRRILAEFLGPR